MAPLGGSKERDGEVDPGGFVFFFGFHSHHVALLVTRSYDRGSWPTN